MLRFRHLLFTILLVLLSGGFLCRGQVKLKDFGWDKARNGAERAGVLYEAHKYAADHGSYVDYSGYKIIDIEITKGFKSIPLSDYNDFCGVVFNVKNTWKDLPLFTFTQKETPVAVGKKLLDGTNFRSIRELANGEYILIIKDQTPWVDKRVGHDYAHIRKDIIWIKDGRSANKVISGYNTPESAPACSFCPVSSTDKVIANFTLNRNKESTKRTDCMLVQRQAHLRIRNIIINTPSGALTHDAAFKIEDCVDVTLSDIKVNGTYSKSDSFGYAFNFNNIWNTRFVRVDGYGEWGVMGHNNLSDTYLVQCHINRFDIHCYGRNLYLTDCVIDGGEKGWFCGGSGIYGTIQCDRCHYINAYPIYYGDSYKTAVGAEIVLNDCIFDVRPQKNAIFYTRVLNSNINPRPGLSQKCLPNITINNMTVNVPKGVKKVYLMDMYRQPTYEGTVGYMKRITINGLTVNAEDPASQVSFLFSSVPLVTEKGVSVSIKNMKAENAVVSMKCSSNRTDKVKIRQSDFLVKENYREGLRVRTRGSNIRVF